MTLEMTPLQEEGMKKLSGDTYVFSGRVSHNTLRAHDESKEEKVSCTCSLGWCHLPEHDELYR